MKNKINRVFSSRFLFIALLVVFVFQSVWFAAAIKYRVPPDERYHFQLTNYYSERGLLDGPVISDQGDQIFSLGDVQRVPSYLYHYSLSFPLKIAKKITQQESQQVQFLRLINVIYTLLGLLILYKIFKLIGLSKLQINFVYLALVTTGMYSWLGASVNYDNLAMPFFWLSLYYLLIFTKNAKLSDALLFISLSMITVLVKVTFAPILVISSLVALVYLYKNKKINLRKYKKQINLKNTKLIIATVVLLISSILFVERILLNIINYGAITPKCDVIHSVEECSQNGIYLRGVEQKKVVSELKIQGEELVVNPIEYTSNWIMLMYDRIYFYLGHKQMQPTQNARLVALITLIFGVVLVFLKRRKLLNNEQIKIIAIATISYILILFFYNLNGHISNWAKFGWQGRYLLPILPFVYVFAVLLFFSAYKDSSKITRLLLLTCLSVIALLNIYHHSPVLVFLRGSDDTWYTQSFISINNDIRDFFIDINLIDKNQIEYLDSPD
jgi:hypothetical protein